MAARSLFVLLLIVCSLVIAGNVVQADSAVDVRLERGLAPEMRENVMKASAKQATFACGDATGKSIPSEFINDNYCDCPNGADEYGTSACSHLNADQLDQKKTFFCQNRGFVPKTIFASFVNDGFCDCCDGSDEFDGRIKCANTCKEQGKVIVDELQQKLAKVRAGLSQKREHEKSGTRDLKQKRQDLKDKQDRIATLEKELKELEDAKAKLENQESIEKELLREKERKKREEEEAKRKAEEAAAAPAAPAQEQQQQAATESASTEGTQQQGTEEAKADQPTPSQESAFENADLNKLEDIFIDYKNEGIAAALRRTWRILLQFYYQILQWIYGKFNPTEAEKARSAYNLKKSEVDGLRTEISELEKITSQSFGDSNQWYYLRDKGCINYDTREYTYELCFYKDINQKDKRNGGSVLLGKWGSWQQNGLVQQYEGGLTCWQGPARSVAVSFVCGNEDKILKTEEPNRCVYSMLVESPSACADSEEQDIVRKLKDLDAI